MDAIWHQEIFFFLQNPIHKLQFGFIFFVSCHNQQKDPSHPTQSRASDLKVFFSEML